MHISAQNPPIYPRSIPSILRRFCLLLILLLVPLPPLFGLDVKIVLVTQKDGKEVPLKPVYEFRRSPFGGYVATTWPFGMAVDNTPILEFEETLLKAALEDFEFAEQVGKIEDDIGEIPGFEDEPPVVPGLSRPASVTLNLAEGDHLIQPGDLQFSIKQGKLTTDDTRLSIGEDRATLKIVCWPVTIRGNNGIRSVPFEASLSYAKWSMLDGIFKVLKDPEEKKLISREEKSGIRRFQQIRMFLPPSLAERRYRMNGVPFAVGKNGDVSCGKSSRVSLFGGTDLRVHFPLPPPSRLIGIRWLNCGSDYTVTSRYTVLARSNPSGASLLEASVPPSAKSIPLHFQKLKSHSRADANVPATFDEFPFKTVLFDGAPIAAGVYLFETRQLAVVPGGDYSFRLYAISGKDKSLSSALGFSIERLNGSAAPKQLRVNSGGGSFNCKIPNDATAGIYVLSAKGNHPLSDKRLGLVFISSQTLNSVASVYTYRNRGGFIAGEDLVNLYWTIRSAKDAPAVGKIEIVLKGKHLERVIAIDDSPAESVVTNHVALKTSGLAPGRYEVFVRPESLPQYPARFHIYQQHPKTDYEIYSQAPFSEIPFYASPVTAYYAMGTGANQPGLAALADQAYGNLDAAFGVYSINQAGPAIEKCILPDEDEVGLMTLARLGKRAVPSMPIMLHHEEWNPKHTLPEELRRLRRRNSLFTQKYCDLSAFGGIRLNWYATLGGYWEESSRLDGSQARRNQEANKWAGQWAAKKVEEEKIKNTDPEHLKIVQQQAGFEARSLILPNAYQHYLASAKLIKSGLSSHSAIPDFWLGGGGSYPPLAYSTLSHRDAVDYTDYGRTPWGDFRAPAFLGMDNPKNQKTQVGFMAHGRHARFIISFGSTGRGLDGFAVNPERGGNTPLTSDHEALLKIFERYGSYFTALSPLPDVAVYFSKSSPWAHQKSVILHDLARLRRPGVLLSQEEVLRGELAKYKVLFLAAIGDEEPRAIKEAFEEFHKNGGHIVKDKYCSKWVPGIDLGFPYDNNHVPKRAWGLGGPNGEWEFAFLWGKFLSDREAPLLKAFKDAPTIPVSTDDKEILISPLAGKETICCFVINKTYVPMSIGGKWRQHAALPRKADLLVEDGWFVYDLLEGGEQKLEKRNGVNHLSMDFTRAEGRLYFMARERPQEVVLSVMRRKDPSGTIDVRAWLADKDGEPIPDPLPFEVTLRGPEGEILFHKFAALGKNKYLLFNPPAMNAGKKLSLSVRDLVIGCTATQELTPSNPEFVKSHQIVDKINDWGQELIFKREGRVIVLLDEGQQKYESAARMMVALLKKRGRDAKLKELDPADVYELPLRWKRLPEDEKLLADVHAGEAIAWRVDLAPYSHAKENKFDRPTVGYPEYGPRTMIDGDVILFGSPGDHRCLEDLDEFLRRRPSPNYPSPGRFFIHYIRDAFLGESDVLYIGCKDAAGAEAAVVFLRKEKPSEVKAEWSDVTPPEITKSKEQAELPNLLKGKIGTRILDFGWSPDGERIFLTLDSYGDSFFVLDKDGKVLSKRPINNRLGNNVWWRNSGKLKPLSDKQVYIGLWNNDYLFDMDKGFLHRLSKPHHGLPGRIKVKPLGDVLYQDFKHGRTYLGGFQKIYALDRAGRQLWVYDDVPVRTGTYDIRFRRSLFIRGVSSSGKRLLASGFGIEQDVYGIGTMRNNSVFCIDTETGKILWDKNGLVLNEGKAIVTDDRIIIIDDDGRFHLVDSDSGKPVGKFKAVQGSDYLLPVSGSDYLLVVENNQFDVDGLSCNAYLRAAGNRPDIVLDIDGRVTDVQMTSDNKSVVLSSMRGQTVCFELDGKVRWRADTPTGGRVRFSPDGKVCGVGTDEGTLYFFNTADGEPIRQIDFNPFNLTSPEQYVKQRSSPGNVAIAKTAQAQPAFPERSYLESLNKESVKFGENLLPPKRLLASLKTGSIPEGDPAKPKSLSVLDRPAVFNLKVKPKTTYLVEIMNATADTKQLTGQSRIEVSITAPAKNKYLPFTGRLPISSKLTRRRMAFRTDKETQVTISWGLIVPTTQGEGRQARTSYDKPKDSPMPMLLGDVVVAAMKFQSRNFLLNRDAGKMGARKGPLPRGEIKCDVVPWRGGVSYIRWQPWDAPKSAFRVTDGFIGNQETKWQETRDVSTGSAVKMANAYVTFRKPELINAITIYEDNRGPVVSGKGVKEMTSAHYGVYIHEVETNKTRRVGYVAGNSNLVNVFTFPAVKIDKIHYFHAGRPYVGMTDGMVRMAEFEAYSTEEAELDMDDAELEAIEGDGLDLELPE